MNKFVWFMILGFLFSSSAESSISRSQISRAYNSAKSSTKAASHSLSQARANLKNTKYQPIKPGIKPFTKTINYTSTTSLINKAENKLIEIDEKIEELRNVSIALQSDKNKLEQDKIALKTREKLFSMGFYASLATAMLAGLALLIRVPTSRIEHRIKELELERARIELETLKKNET